MSWYKKYIIKKGKRERESKEEKIPGQRGGKQKKGHLSWISILMNDGLNLMFGINISRRRQQGIRLLLYPSSYHPSFPTYYCLSQYYDPLYMFQKRIKNMREWKREREDQNLLLYFSCPLFSRLCFFCLSFLSVHTVCLIFTSLSLIRSPTHTHIPFSLDPS